MSLKLLDKLMKIELRPWTEEDLFFTLQVRNHPKIMRWFRQDEPVPVHIQREFIRNDKGYNGRIIELDGKPIGLCGVKDTKEFTISVLPEYQHKGISTRVMQQLIEKHKGIWSAVFVGNPALEWFIAKLGFKVVSVKERAYHKRGYGLVDIVAIKHE